MPEAGVYRGRPERRTRGSRFSPAFARHGLPATLNVDPLAPPQVALFALHVRIDEIGRQLRSNDFIPRSPERSVSPEPIYGADGKRTNTRDVRYKRKLEEERHALVQLATKLDATYRPPADYRRLNRLMEKIYIPVNEFPHINFIGQLLGPRGSTLKMMEADSGAKIAIRGKGSVKEGKGAPTSYQNQEEDLHCLITADTEDKVTKGVELVNKVIETAVSVPEAENELKRKQLRDLAALNGTLRDDENAVCQNCGGIGHKRFNCPERNNYTNSIICRLCGNAGHMARDCVARHNPEAMAEVRERDAKLDMEYASLMAELGDSSAGGAGGAGPLGGAPAGGAAPWARGGPARGISFAPRDDANGGAGGAAPWARPNEEPAGGTAPPPWAAGTTQADVGAGAAAAVAGAAAPGAYDAYAAAAAGAQPGMPGYDAQTAAYWAYYYAQQQQAAAAGGAAAGAADPYAAYYAAQQQQHQHHQQ